MAYENLCMNCMKEKGSNEQCPHCHFHNDSLQLPPFLPMRSMLGGKYLVGAVTESNGDGTTYMGFDTETQKAVMIREFLPDTMVKRSSDSNALLVREGSVNRYNSMLGSFMDLWSKLAKMNGLSALIGVQTVFEENNTAYAICDYVEGVQSLRDYLLNTKNGYLSWKDARVMFMPVLSTLATLHSAGIIHRGLSPATLYIYPDHRIRIGGFSIPECRTVTSGLPTEIFPGYTPVEQLGVQTAAGAWTDIYSFAAVLYRTLTGKAPIDAMVRMENDEMMIPAEFAKKIPTHVIGALVNALQVMPEDRTRTIDRFRGELSASQVTEFQSEYEQEEKARKRRIYEKAATPEIAEPDEPTQVISGLETVAAEPMATQQESSGDRKGVGLIAFLIVLCIALAALLGLLLTGKIGSLGLLTNEDTTVAEETVDVPNFVGMAYSSIQSNSTLTANFQFEIVEEYSDDVASGYVIEQSVGEGTTVTKGTKITLTVSKGVEKVTMPDVVGKTLSAATAELENKGFVVSSITKANPGGNTAGTVASASYNAGDAVEKGATVILTVWDEPTTTTTEETTVEDVDEDDDLLDDILP